MHSDIFYLSHAKSNSLDFFSQKGREYDTHLKCQSDLYSKFCENFQDLFITGAISKYAGFIKRLYFLKDK